VNADIINRLNESRGRLLAGLDLASVARKGEEEGGCGVVGFCCSEPVPGKHIYEPSKQMHNRGNGKGGGIAAVGFVPEELGVSREVLDDCYMVHIALLDPECLNEMEQEFLVPHFDIHASSMLETVEDWTAVPGLEVKPPEVKRYFVRVKGNVLDVFIKENSFRELKGREAEDEFINQNSFKLNQKYYASLGKQRAFVLSHGRNIMILKVVGYAEAIVQYYKIENLKAHTWIAHQRFPTRGRVWHPGGAHPFAGVNMALVHNGDFANYHSVSEHLLQRNIYPQFLTDTEVSALLFDLLNRTYQYPLEYIIEALAPTTELDFDRLPEEKQKIYRAIQATHIHGSPDGPWFFIITRNNPELHQYQLLGITDTAMLRPQVFAFHDGEVQVGLIGSEKQAIDATMKSLAADDIRICPVADKYWNARGGSHTDGGSFIFNLEKDSSGKIRMTCTDKFGKTVEMPRGAEPCDFSADVKPSDSMTGDIKKWIEDLIHTGAEGLFKYIRDNMHGWNFDEIRTVCRMISDRAKDPDLTGTAIAALTMMNDYIYPVGDKKKSHIIHIVRTELDRLFLGLPLLGDDRVRGAKYHIIDFDTRTSLRAPMTGEKTLVINAERFPPEGDHCDAALLVDAYMKGWKNFITIRSKGQRYIGCGLGPDTDGVRIDSYDSVGDYLGSGIDGLEVHVHNNGQDQFAQIIKRGRLVIHGDVGQTFMYGAKGGDVYVRGNAAGRPLINSVGRPRVVINGTCLDFLGESFMAGDPHNDGGFVVLNGVRFDDNGNITELEEPYPGSNIFSLASGGAVFIRDPHETVVEQQLNGGQLKPFDDRDWELILPYLEENERLFNISIDDLLTVKGQRMGHLDVYRKVVPHVTGELAGSAVAAMNEEVLEEEVMYQEAAVD